jgi:aspartate/methionine/tyrosine aminotransferase
VISFSSLSKAYLAPGWRTGWLSIGRSPRLDDVAAAIRKLADGRLCSTVPMQYAVTAALTGDKSHQVSFRATLKERATITAECMRAMGADCSTPTAGFYAMPRIPLPPGRTDQDYVLGLLRETGVLVVYGSGFGLPEQDGYLRIVFLADPQELREVYRLMASFTADFLR